MWRVRRLTCNNSMAYLKNWTDNFFQIFFMGTSWVAVSINNIKTRARSEMTSQKNIKIFDFNGVNVAKHWHVAGRGICHLWLPCLYCFHILHTLDWYIIYMREEGLWVRWVWFGYCYSIGHFESFLPMFEGSI